MEDINKLMTSGDGKEVHRGAIMQVLAGLMLNPLLFANKDRYRFDIEDFPESFYRIIFGAIEHLAAQGMEHIDIIDVDDFIKGYPTQYVIFNQANGTGYLQQILEIYDAQKFDYYYQLLKKYSLINYLRQRGVDTTDIYNPELVDPNEIAKMRANFDNMSVNDILLREETKIINAKEKFGTSTDRVENHAGDGLRELKERFKKTPDMGLALLSPKLTTILRGQRRGCLFMESSIQGGGKSRRGNGEACNLAVPEYYSVAEQRWVHTGNHERVLMISTELEEYECQQMWMAFIAGVSEAHIKDGRYEPGEEERVDHAIRLLEESNLYFVSITNYDTEDITNIIKKYAQLKKIEYVFFDYIGETLKITSSATRKAGVQGLRTDQVLLLLSSALKDVAKTLGLYIWTASQVSGDVKNAKDLDASYLRSAKSLADKVDAGMMLMPVLDKDQPIIDSHCARGFELRPNFVITVYKVRAGSYQNIKVYVYFDRGTCQMTDCFVTDRDGNILTVQEYKPYRADAGAEDETDEAAIKERNQLLDQTAEEMTIDPYDEEDF